MSHEHWRFFRQTIALTTLLGIGFATASDLGAQNKIPNYRLVENWPQYPRDMQFEMGTGIAVDGKGVVYAISRDIDHWASHPLAMTRYRGRGTIAMFDRSGKFLGKFAEKEQFIASDLLGRAIRLPWPIIRLASRGQCQLLSSAN
jgi:hypothetical protein